MSFLEIYLLPAMLILEVLGWVFGFEPHDQAFWQYVIAPTLSLWLCGIAMLFVYLAITTYGRGGRS